MVGSDKTTTVMGAGYQDNKIAAFINEWFCLSGYKQLGISTAK